MHRTLTSASQAPIAATMHRLGAFTALGFMPLVAYGLSRLAWDQAHVVLTNGQAFSEAGLSTLSLGQALSPVAAAIGALVAVHLAWTALALVAIPRHSRLRSAVAAMTPIAWRRIVTLATTGTLSLGLAIPATANTDTTALDSTDAGWVTTPVTATTEADPLPPEVTSPEPTAEVAPAATEVTNASDPSSETTGDKRAPADDQVAVSAGDTLWAITAKQLDIDLDDHGAIASAWPELYEENRQLIGKDPGLIVPGQNLTVPARWTA